MKVRTIAALAGLPYFQTLDRIRRQVGGGDYVTAKCVHCGRAFYRKQSRPQWRKRPFCSPECYYAGRHGENFVQHRPGGRKAREVAARYFDLKPEHVVHHHDKNQRHNHPSNLAVFASQSDHMAFHHGNPDAQPLWDGRELRAEAVA